MSKKDVRVGDRVQTIKGRGIVIEDYDTGVVVELDGDHGTYFFDNNGVWIIAEDNHMNFDNLVITKVISADFWYHTCPNCGYKNLKENRVEVCPDCGTDLRFGHMENI